MLSSGYFSKEPQQRVGVGGVCRREAPPHRVLLGYRSTPTQSPEWSFECSWWGLKISRDGKAPLYSWPVTTTLPWRLWLRLWVVPMQGRFRGFTPACAGELLWRCQFVIHQNCNPRLLSVWRGVPWSAHTASPSTQFTATQAIG